VQHDTKVSAAKAPCCTAGRQPGACEMILTPQPYCSRCHVQLFGTRTLRQANLPDSSSSASLSSLAREGHSNPPSTSPTTVFRQTQAQTPIATPGSPTRFGARPLSSIQSSLYSSPSLNSVSKPLPQTPDKPVSSSMSTEISSPTVTDPDTSYTRPDFRSDRPIAIPYAGGPKALDERGLLRRGDSPRSKVGQRPEGGEDCCWGCERKVYAAEQVCGIFTG
jgi:hypothetical protein